MHFHPGADLTGLADRIPSSRCSRICTSASLSPQCRYTRYVYHGKLLNNKIFIPQKCLDGLSASLDEGELKCKEYGKAKIYYINQVTLHLKDLSCQFQFVVTSTHRSQAGLPAQASEGELKRLDSAVREGSSRLAELSSAVSSMRRAADALAAEPEDLQMGRYAECFIIVCGPYISINTDNNEYNHIHSALVDLEVRVSEKRQRLKQVQATTIDEEERDELVEEHNHYLSLWRKRKRACLDAVDMIADGMEKSKPHVLVRLLLFFNTQLFY